MQVIWKWFTRNFRHNRVPPERYETTQKPNMASPGTLVLANGMALPQGEALLSLFTPDGEIVANPTDDLLNRLVFETHWAEHWGNDGVITFAWFLYTPSGVPIFNSVPDKPEIFFFRRAPYGFYFIFRDPGGRESVPDNGSNSAEMVSHHLGGNAYLFPATGFVPPATALAILLEFARSGHPDASVTWVEAPPLIDP